jgi:hypothetical protein
MVTDEQLARAKELVDVLHKALKIGREMGMKPYGVRSCLTTAIEEEKKSAGQHEAA